MTALQESYGSRSLAARLSQRIRAGGMQGLLGGAARVLIIRLTGAVLGYLSMALLARWLGAFDFGVYAYVWVWIVTLGIVLSLGYYHTALRYIPEYMARRRWRRLNGFMRHSFLVVTISGIAGAVCAAALILLLRDRVDSYYVTPLLIGAACLPFSALLVQFEGIARAFGWIGLAYSPGYVLRPLFLTGAVAIALTLGFMPGSVEALWAVFISCLLAVIVQGTLIWRYQRSHFPPLRPVDSPGWLKISLSFLMIEGFRLVLDNVDVILIGQLLAPDDVAVYFATMRTGGLVAFVYFAVAALAVPRFSQLHANGRKGEMQVFVGGAIRLMFWPTFAAALGLAVLGPFVLSVFGEDFGAGYPVLLVILTGLVIRAALGPVEFLLNMTGHQLDTVRVYGVAAMADVGLNLVLIPRYGIFGAAMATYIAVIGANLVLCALAYRRLGVLSFVWIPAGLRR
jgi:O-antigen/teichoic acid export membrane protein